MARMRVNPTRMELTRLKRRLKTAVRGHKLLKDKRDEMVRRFMELVQQNKTLRESVEEKLDVALKQFLKARMTMAPEAMHEALMYPVKTVSMDFGVKNIMSVNVPEITMHESNTERQFLPYGLLSTSSELDMAVVKLESVLSEMVRLSSIEKACEMLSDEIEKTRRRVNALEYVMIPRLTETIKYIVMKLDENERGNLVRLMKTKDMIKER